MNLVFKIIGTMFFVFIIVAIVILLRRNSNIDILNDVNNCGFIGNKCSDKQICNNGKCNCKYVCKYNLNDNTDDKTICACYSADKSINSFCTDFFTDVNNCGGCDIKCNTINDEECINAKCKTRDRRKAKESFYYTKQSPYDFSNIWNDSSKEKLFIILNSKSALNDIQIKCVMDYVMTKHRPNIMNLGLGDILNIASGYFDPGSKWRACLDIK